MIISHRYHYVFVQNARTASSSMGVELCQCYAGEEILRKHAPYSDFLKEASEEERRYFAFTGQRNPLDALATLFFRAKYQNMERMKARPDSVNRKHAIQPSQIAKWKYISENDLSFVQFFNRYHGNRPDRSHLKLEREKMSYVYRYENLQQDFSSILNAIGVEQKRDLPLHSKKTRRKDSDFYKYYTPEIQRRVQIVFGQGFRAMGYRFPADWPEPTLFDHVLFYKDYLWSRLQAVARRIR